MHNESNVASRIYSCGFKIDNKIFAVGGLTSMGKLLDSVVQIDYINRKAKEATILKGKNLIEPMHSSAITAVFYESKCGPLGDLKLENIAGEINWGEALELIKYEGFYMFGG